MICQKSIIAGRTATGSSLAEVLAQLAGAHLDQIKASKRRRRRLKTYIQNCSLEGLRESGFSEGSPFILEAWELPQRGASTTIADEIFHGEEGALASCRQPSIVVHESEVWGDPAAPFASAPFKVITAFHPPAAADSDYDRVWASAATQLALGREFQARVRNSRRNVPEAMASTGGTAGQPSAVSQPGPAFDIWRFARIEDVEQLFASAAFREDLATYDRHVTDGLPPRRYVMRERIVFDDARIDPMRWRGLFDYPI